MRKVVIALPKGKRLMVQAYDVFKKAGVTSQALEQEMLKQDWKQLEFVSDDESAKFLVVRADDIPQYVDKNWAEFGIAGFDDYREYELSGATAINGLRGDGFISDILPDLGLCGQSRFCIAGLPEKKDFYMHCKKSDEKILEVATQYPNIAANYFTRKGIVTDIIAVTGSTELMPKHSGADVIFDIVETGRALKENGLIVFEEAMPIQTKILVSKAALKYDENVGKLVRKIENAIK